MLFEETKVLKASLLSRLAQVTLPWAYIGERKASRTLESSTLVKECIRFWKDLKMSTHLYTKMEGKENMWDVLESAR